MELNLPITDEDEIWLFERTVRQLQKRHSHSEQAAIQLVRGYYKRFTDEQYCEQFAMSAQNSAFFLREESLTLADRVHYYEFLQHTPNEDSFIQWERRIESLRRGDV